MEAQELSLVNDNILISGIKPEMSGRVVKGVTQDEKPQEGRVLRVGPGRMLESGKRAEMSVSPGMHVLFNEHTTTKFNLNGKIFFVLREEDVIGFK